MTEALIAQLAKLESLKVISRTSAMRYKEVRKPLPEIGRELGVEGILEGSVLRAGNRVRITAQLIHAPTDRHLWAESYERELRDVLALQGEVAQAVAGAIALRLTAQEERRLASARPVDPRAYDAYLHARFFWNRRSGEALERAIDLFRQAIALDPDYAPAQAGLADAYIVSYDWAYISFSEGLPLARQAAQRAVDLDPGLGEAYAPRAVVPPEEKTCERRRAAAFTNVGPGRTVLCPAFADLSPFEAAAILLHEALHDAGQPEWPSDPEAPTSEQIHHRVREHCIHSRQDGTPRTASTRPAHR